MISDTIHAVVFFLPSIVVGFVVYYFTKKKCIEDANKAIHEAYYKGKEDGELQALRNHIDGNQD